MAKKDEKRCWICGSEGPLKEERTLLGFKKWICSGKRCRGA